MTTNKPYGGSFLLEKTKLDRLVEIIHARLEDHPHTTSHDHFEVFLSDKRCIEKHSVDDVLKLDNSRKSKIQRLLMTCCTSTEKAGRPEHEIQVDFDGRIDDKVRAKVIVSVRNDEAGWNDRALSEVEEQIERTSLQDYRARLGLAVLAVSAAIAFLLLLLSSLSSGRPAIDAAGAMWLRTSDLGRVEQILKQGRTITDEEMREINTMQLRNVLEEQRPKPVFIGWTWQKSFVGGPLLIVSACAFYLLVACYPNAVFLWGDEVERYNKMLQTRQMVRNLIVGGIFFGVLSKVLYAGLFSKP